jgi:hypothetical protein
MAASLRRTLVQHNNTQLFYFTQGAQWGKDAKIILQNSGDDFLASLLLSELCVKQPISFPDT